MKQKIRYSFLDFIRDRKDIFISSTVMFAVVVLALVGLLFSDGPSKINGAELFAKIFWSFIVYAAFNLGFYLDERRIRIYITEMQIEAEQIKSDLLGDVNETFD